MSGARLRKDFGDHHSQGRGNSPGRESPGLSRPLRIVASGVIFVTHTLSLLSFPEEGSNSRAQAVNRVRGGSAAASLSVLAQFSDVKSWLLAPIGSGPEGAAIRIELEREGISTQLCPKREADGVPKAFVLRSGSAGSQTVINHNPIPDITHDEFFRILGPLLYSTLPNGSETPKYGQSPPGPPIDWLHFEGRSPHITSENLQGLDSWLRERDWRQRVVLSVELTKVGTQEIEGLIQLADVVFFSKAYATARSFTSPKAFLLAIRSQVPKHSLLVCSWGKEGAAILSQPTREYFQSSPFVPDPTEEPETSLASVRSSSAGFSGWSGEVPLDQDTSGDEFWTDERRRRWAQGITSTSSSGDHRTEEDEALDEVAADDAFIGGMIFALSRRILPGLPYSPRPAPVSRGGVRNLSPNDVPTVDANSPLYEGRWRLDECLRFATEIAGRRMRRRDTAGLALAMEKVGWRL